MGECVWMCVFIQYHNEFNVFASFLSVVTLETCTCLLQHCSSVFCFISYTSIYLTIYRFLSFKRQTAFGHGCLSPSLHLPQWMLTSRLHSLSAENLLEAFLRCLNPSSTGMSSPVSPGTCIAEEETDSYRYLSFFNNTQPTPLSLVSPDRQTLKRAKTTLRHVVQCIMS